MDDGARRRRGEARRKWRRPSPGWCKREKFFHPGDFLETGPAARGPDAGEELAWQRTLNAVREFGHNASLTAADFEGNGCALWAVSRMGWERLCNEAGRGQPEHLAGGVRPYLPARDGEPGAAGVSGGAAGAVERHGGPGPDAAAVRAAGLGASCRPAGARDRRWTGPEPLELGDLFRRLPGGERDGVD